MADEAYGPDTPGSKTRRNRLLEEFAFYKKLGKEASLVEAAAEDYEASNRGKDFFNSKPDKMYA